MPSVTFLKLDISKAQVTILAASQLVMMQARTSLIFRKAFSAPGTAPHRAPARMPPTKARTQMSPVGMALLGMPRAIIRDAMVPIRYCPGAPMLKSPVL